MSKKIVHTQSAYTFQVEIMFKLTRTWELRPVLWEPGPVLGNFEIGPYSFMY